MKNLLKSLMLLFSLTLLISCGNDDEMNQSCSDGIQNGTETGIDCGGDCATCVTTVEEDKANVQQSFDDLVSCTKEIRDARSFTELFRNFLDMSDGDVLNEEWIEDVFEGLEFVFDFDHVENNNRFDLAHHAGTHIFDANTVSWQKISDVLDEVVLKFPSDANSNTNNVELTLDLYTDEFVVIDGENLSLPKTIHVVMNIDGLKTFEISVSKVTYAENSGFQLPVELEATLFMDPMTLDINVSRLSTTAYDMSMTLNNGLLCDIGISAQFELKDDDFENLDEDGVENAAVQVNLGQLSFRTMGDLASLIAIEDPTESQFNSLLDVDLFFQDAKIGDVEINEDMETILIFYKDNTSENTDGFLMDMEDILAEFFG